MPVPLWTTPNKAEAKYNVVTEFPQLGLHAAAASGNVGLVEYALEHGQPINSVLDGVLPIHAASAGGHPQVVKKLIEHGADVNAPRLPRRYFNDKNRDASAPIVGTSYSTPLHFAAANGNTDVVTLLLLHGAHPDREDKHGVTPEDLARANNWIECAQILRDWVVNKDRDLREREVLSTKDGNGAASSSSQALQLSTSPEPESPSFRRRLHVKQSIDTALNKLKTGSFSETSLKPGPAVSMGSPPHSPMNSFGNYSFDPDARENHSTHEPASRRPSLPQIPQPSPVLDETGRRNTTSSGKMRRPRSAGTGAEPSGEQDACYTPYGRGGAGRRLASKISLLGMFKKAQSSDTSEGISSANTTPVKGSASTTTLPLTPNAPSHGRGSPASAFDSSDVIERDHSRNHASSDASGKGLKITPQPKAHLRPSASFLDLDSSAPPSPLPPSRPPLPSAVDLHNAIANHQQKGPRDRSRSNATAISTFSEFDSDCEDDGIHPPTTRNQGSVRRPSGSSLKPNHFYGNASESKSSLVPTPEEGQKATPPSSILRGHRRTASSSQTSPSPARALRFDSVSTPDRIRKEGSLAGSSTNQSPPLKATASSHSLRLANKDDTQGGLSPDPIEQPQAEDTAPALNDKQEPTQSNHRPPDVDVEGKGKDAHQSSEPQPRPRSFGSASRSSLSPVFTNDNTAQSLAALQSDFPFSIHQPPPTENKSPMNRQLQLPEVGRGRGDSLSSTWTSDSSGMPQYSTGGSTINSSPSPVLHTPGNHTIALPTSKKISDDEETYNHIIRSDSGGSESVRQSSPRSNGQITLNERRAHSPLDIDIGAISSHEQAKALVEKTRQDILELASGQDVGLTVSNTGSTPLSAKLAAYGESLALQRRLEEQEKMGQESTPPSADDIISAPARFVGHGVERQLSLDKAGRNHKPRTRGKDPRRPSTADGLSSRGPHNSFFPGEHIRTHQSSMSVSPPGIAQASSTSFDGREFLSSHQRFPASITPSKSLMTVPEPLLSPITPHPIAESDYGSEAPSDFADTETESSPFPSRHTALVSATGLPRNKLPVMARSHNSAKKLNRMGFTVVDQVARPVAQPHSGKLLGGFKSIMQSLKGK